MKYQYCNILCKGKKIKPNRTKTKNQSKIERKKTKQKRNATYAKRNKDNPIHALRGAPPNPNPNPTRLSPFTIPLKSFQPFVFLSLFPCMYQAHPIVRPSIPPYISMMCDVYECYYRVCSKIFQFPNAPPILPR